MVTDGSRTGVGEEDRPSFAPSPPGGLMDVLAVAAVVIDASGRIVLWSPQAEELMGFRASEVLGRPAVRTLVPPEYRDRAQKLFAEVMAESSGAWAGVFPVRHRDGGVRLLEFRNMRLTDDRGDPYALGLATDQGTVRQVEREVALSTRVVAQSPIGVAVFDTRLRTVSVNPALGDIAGLPPHARLDRSVRHILPFVDSDTAESVMRDVLRTGTPLRDQPVLGRPAGDPDHEHAWHLSYFRLESAGGDVLGLTVALRDITQQHEAATEAARARERLTTIADATARIGTTLDLEQTARELADAVVPRLADLAAVDILEDVLEHRGGPGEASGPPVFRALALAEADPTEAARAADPVGEAARYGTDRLVARCVATGAPVRVPRVRPTDLALIARDAESARLLDRAGLHSYLAVPLIARGTVLGALDLKRIGNPEPFDEDDVVLARELAGRAAISIDNARWYQRERATALTLQRSLLPQLPEPQPGLEIAYRYQPAGAASEVGGDWFDVIPLAGGRTALVVGDVMGSGVTAAATMGQVRTTIRALAHLHLEPDGILRSVDRSSTGLEQSIATCLYAVYDPATGECRLASAGHLPPVLARPGLPAQLLDLPTGAPLGVGTVPFHSTAVRLRPDDELVLYTDGLVEVRGQDIDERLALLRKLLTPGAGLQETCDRLLRALRHPDHHDDIALLIARITRR
ncbi:PAS domain S-box protein [Streptomyces sp. RKND-216]|uniref:SpoIIE family protein phosphatase n=1 Tax=Streptomyces sp. RKND-216 TaxID=2562581 RepID=UPI00109DE7DF|nr:SpoIIE family protein phosphatase [Streptomyces sp. RKND-216]THA25578.1 PAS domain S-box protein [Streptomyces sp. RKND-216]